MTMEFDKRSNGCARNLNDGKLLDRLTGEDIVAQELKYHRSFSAVLYNTEMAFIATTTKESKYQSLEKKNTL